MKVAVVSSGLWHIRRGIEVWASTLADALAERDMEVTLFAGSEVTGYNQKVKCKTEVLSCWYRGTNKNRFWTKFFSRLGGWRYGFGSEYQTEQTTIAPRLISALRNGDFNIVHLQDPWLALSLEKAYLGRKHSAKVILAHGTEEPIEFLDRFSHVQELSPYYLARHKGRTGPEQTRQCIPNFVDTGMFKPSDKIACRRTLGLPEESFIIFSVGAIDHEHKRMRTLVDEFASIDRKDALLVMAGPCGGDAGLELVEYATKLLSGRFRYFGDLTHSGMPALYSSSDLFVLCSKTEIFGIAFLEAMACGIPCVGHIYPVTEWVIGDGGNAIDMNKGGFVGEVLSRTDEGWLRTYGLRARERVEKMFSTEVVVRQIVKMYEEVNNKQ